MVDIGTDDQTGYIPVASYLSTPVSSPVEGHILEITTHMPSIRERSCISGSWDTSAWCEVVVLTLGCVEIVHMFILGDGGEASCLLGGIGEWRRGLCTFYRLERWVVIRTPRLKPVDTSAPTLLRPLFIWKFTTG